MILTFCWRSIFKNALYSPKTLTDPALWMHWYEISQWISKSCWLHLETGWRQNVTLDTIDHDLQLLYISTCNSIVAKTIQFNWSNPKYLCWRQNKYLRLVCSDATIITICIKHRPKIWGNMCQKLWRVILLQKKYIWMWWCYYFLKITRWVHFLWDSLHFLLNKNLILSPTLYFGVWN